MTKPTIFQQLAAPFEPKDVEWRVGSTSKDKSKGMALAYVDARAVMDRLDAVCGPAGWQDRYEFDGPRTICYLSICVDGAWITKADGAGDTAVEAEKGSISSAFKRAAVKWGIGRYLYDVASPWVKLNQYKQIEPSEFDRLRKILPARIEAADDTEKPADKPADPPPPPLMPHKIAPPKFGPNASADEKTHGWRNWLTAMRDAIDNAPTLDELNKWISLNNDGLDGLRDFNPDGEDFLLKRADNKRGVFAQAPKTEKAA